jgi:hypothetical protein
VKIGEWRLESEVESGGLRVENVKLKVRSEE